VSFERDRRRVVARLIVALAALVAVVATLAGGTAVARRLDTSRPETALAALRGLEVRGRAPLTGYSRAQFGDGWASVNGCDQRDRILRRDLTAQRIATDGCRVLSGTLRDPYTGRTIFYVRGGASEVDIDHVVALADAWQKGARRWSANRRVSFANDPLNLLAVGSSINRSKGDGDAATWLPPRKAFRCAYVARQVAVKRRYDLWVTRAERRAIARVLHKCPEQRLPTSGPAPQVSSSAPAPSSPSGPQKVRVFANCTAARAAGVTPIRRSTNPALYKANRGLDRDGDGVACES
jgi:Protein of unknown function (DUF1524)/Excalibur calcium-binding domain